MELPIVGVLALVIERLLGFMKPGAKEALTRLGASEDFQKLFIRVLSLMLGFLFAAGVLVVTDVFAGTMLAAASVNYKIIVLGVILGAASNGVHYSLQEGNDLVKAIIEYIVGKSEVEQQRAQAIKQQAISPARNVTLGQ